MRNLILVLVIPALCGCATQIKDRSHWDIRFEHSVTAEKGGIITLQIPRSIINKISANKDTIILEIRKVEIQ